MTYNNFHPTWTSLQDTICPCEIVNILKLTGFFLLLVAYLENLKFQEEYLINWIACFPFSKSEQKSTRTIFEQSYIILPDYLSVAMLVQVAVALVVVANLRRI